MNTGTVQDLAAVVDEDPRVVRDAITYSTGVSLSEGVSFVLILVGSALTVQLLRYTLVVESGEIFKDKLLCEECASDFRNLDRVEVHEGPVLMRGGDDEGEQG